MDVRKDPNVRLVLFMGNKFGDAYREERRRIHREALRPRRQPKPAREPRQDNVRPIVQAVVSTAIGIVQASAITGAPDVVPGYGGTADDNWGRTHLQEQQTRRSQTLDEGTRAAGYQSGWYGQG